jgi:DNA-binding Lrp family transcriptional regulator
MGNVVSHQNEFMKDTALLHQLDAIDWKIMKILQEDGRLSNAELAERVSLSASPCWKRLKRLETSGVIRGYQAILDRRALGMGVVAFVSISLENHTEKLCHAFEAAVAEVLACHNTTGQHDYLLHIVARDFDAYSEFVRNRLRTLPGVKELLSTLSMHEVKSSTKLHL